MYCVLFGMGSSYVSYEVSIILYFLFIYFLDKPEKIFARPGRKRRIKINEERQHFKCHLSRGYSAEKLVVLFRCAGSAVRTF